MVSGLRFRAQCLIRFKGSTGAKGFVGFVSGSPCVGHVVHFV